MLTSDRAGSSWYVGLGFFFAPVLAAVSPWPTVTAALWMVIAVAGLWLGLLGIAMATGLALVMRSGAEIPEDYWRSIIDYDAQDHRRPRPPTPKTTDGPERASGWRTIRCSRPASA